MTAINFQQFSMPTGINRGRHQSGDARESFANLIYTNVSGIKAHHLAFKIYESEGAIEYSPDEVALINSVAERFCLPNFIDGLREQINNQSKTE